MCVLSNNTDTSWRIKRWMITSLDVTELRNGYYTPQFGSGTGLKIEAYIRYADAEVEFTPGFWNVIKWAWIQYASILIIVLYVVGSIKNFVFRNQLVPTWNEKEIKYISE